MVDIASIAAGVNLEKDGIWYGTSSQKLSYPTEGNEDAFLLEENSFWFQHRNNCIATAVKLFPPNNGGAIFDIGAGNGFVSLNLERNGFEVVALEPGINGARNAKKRGLKNVICATSDSAEIVPGSIKAIGLFDVIEHIEDDKGFLNQFINLLSEDGKIYATVPSFSILWSEQDVHAGHFRRYSLSEIVHLFEHSGYEVEYSSYFFRFLPIPIFIFRVLPYWLGISSLTAKFLNHKREHSKRKGFIALITDKLFRREIKRISRGGKIRFGASCLIVAKKLSQG